MVPETLDLYLKYRWFLHLLSNERLFYFVKNKEELDYDKFFDSYNYVIMMHWKIKPYWRDFRKRRAYLLKKFEYGKYELLLRSKFCYDIKTLILAYIMKK